jgi:hypothetical protein
MNKPIQVSVPLEEVKMYKAMYKKYGMNVIINPTGISREHRSMLDRAVKIKKRIHNI